MALVEFENKPSINTPINATNLNNNFSKLANRLQIDKIWENDGTITSWVDSKLQIDISNYDFLIIVPSHSAPTIVNTNLLDFYFSWNGYYSAQSKDAATQRHIYKENNDIHWGECFYRGINGATGVGNANDIDYPRQVYGIKIGDL